MARRAWLVKSEPGSYAWERFAREGGAVWDGVRNAQARNHLAGMARGDRVLFYHSGDAREVVGLAKVVRTAYPEPGADDPRWPAVDLAPVRALARPVTLAAIRSERSLAAIPLLRQSRLSVMPLEPEAFERILALAEAAPAARADAPRRRKA